MELSSIKDLLNGLYNAVSEYEELLRELDADDFQSAKRVIQRLKYAKHDGPGYTNNVKFTIPPETDMKRIPDIISDHLFEAMGKHRLFCTRYVETNLASKPKTYADLI